MPSQTTKQIDTLPLWVKALTILVVLLIVYFSIKSISNKIAASKKQALLENSQATTTVNNVPVSVDLGTKASAIYNAFYSNDWFGFSENETQAMTELENVPKALIPQLSAIYNSLYNKNLKTDFQKYLSAQQWNQISNLFN